MRRNRHQKWKLEKRGGTSGSGSGEHEEDPSDSKSESEQPSIFDSVPLPKFFATSSAPTEQDAEEWMRARDEPIPTGTPPDIVNRFNDNRAMTKNVLVAAKRDPTKEL